MKRLKAFIKVLTAAHCLQDSNLSFYTLYIGLQNIEEIKPKNQIEIRNIYMVIGNHINIFDEQK